MATKKSTRSKRKKKTFVWLPTALSLLLLIIAAVLSWAMYYWQPKPSLATNNLDVFPKSVPSADWQLNKIASSHQVEGYASLASVQPGSSINLQISCSSKTFTTDVYRMGWYGGVGAQHMTFIDSRACTKDSVPSPDPATGLLDLNWPTSLRLHIPTSWQAGIYLAKLTNSDGYQNYIPFTVRSAGPQSNYLFVHALNTDLAYNLWGGNSLYKGFTPALSINRAVKASLNRPFVMPDDGYDGSGNFLTWEYPMVKFLEQYNYKVDYATDIDIQKNPGLLLKYKAVIITGHNEYWSKQMFDGYQAAVNQGVSLAVFGANTAFRPVRFEPDPKTGIPDRIMVNYKSAELDPYTKTHPQYSTPAAWRLPPLNRPESKLLGLAYEGETTDNARASGDLTVSDASNWIFKGSGLKNGDKISGLVGYEYDRFNASLPAPPNLDIVFHSPLSNIKNQPDFADAAYYYAQSGAQVFNAGTVEWSWGLDPVKPTYSPQLVKITQNILNRFGQ